MIRTCTACSPVYRSALFCGNAIQRKEWRSAVKTKNRQSISINTDRRIEGHFQSKTPSKSRTHSVAHASFHSIEFVQNHAATDDKQNRQHNKQSLRRSKIPTAFSPHEVFDVILSYPTKNVNFCSRIAHCHISFFCIKLIVEILPTGNIIP